MTQDMRQWLSAVLEKNRSQMEKDLKALEPKERLQILERLMQYVIPKQQAVSAAVDFSKLTDSQMDTIVTEITKGIDNED